MKDPDLLRELGQMSGEKDFGDAGSDNDTSNDLGMSAGREAFGSRGGRGIRSETEDDDDVEPDQMGDDDDDDSDEMDDDAEIMDYDELAALEDMEVRTAQSLMDKQTDTHTQTH